MISDYVLTSLALEAKLKLLGDNICLLKSPKALKYQASSKKRLL